MRTRKWRQMVRPSHVYVYVAALSVLGCKKSQEQSVSIQIMDGRNSPVPDVAVIPIYSTVGSQGWWQQGQIERSGDTLWSNSTGHIHLSNQPEEYAWNALLIELKTSNDLPRTYYAPLPFERPVPVLRCILVPSSLTVQFAGNRVGNTASVGCWIQDEMDGHQPDSSCWFTPGIAPRPSLFKTVWIHPNEPFPVRRAFRMLTPSGSQQALPPILIQADNVGDTLIHSIEF